FVSSRRRHTSSKRDWSSDVCSSDLGGVFADLLGQPGFGAEDFGQALPQAGHLGQAREVRSAHRRCRAARRDVPGGGRRRFARRGHRDLKKLHDQLADLEISTLLNHEYDERSAVVTVRSGAGGDDATDWAQTLTRMYV